MTIPSPPFAELPELTIHHLHAIGISFVGLPCEVQQWKNKHPLDLDIGAFLCVPQPWRVSLAPIPQSCSLRLLPADPLSN